MAESTSVNQDDVVCRYFFLSSCRDGSKCLFSHDRTRHTPDSVCRYYLQGTCIFGANCRYDHVSVTKFKNQNDQQFAGSSQNSADNDVSSNFKCVTSSNNTSQLEMLNKVTVSNNLSSLKACSSVQNPTNWVNAPEFVPKNTKSYAETVKINTVTNEPNEISCTELCPFYIFGDCPFDDQCAYVHGLICELCNKACLHPFVEEQRKAHVKACEKELEKDMELSFAIQYSLGKTCGICMDAVLEKEQISERRFGILEKCNHVYCLTCIRKWRRSKQCENNERVSNALDPIVTRACPECRIPSDFVIPSTYFVENEEEKTKLITEYKNALSKKHCKYFQNGKGICPFGESCFYLHAKPDGTKIDFPLPTRRQRHNQDGELDYVGQILLWDFLEHRDDTDSIIDLTDFNFSESDLEDNEVSD